MKRKIVAVCMALFLLGAMLPTAFAAEKQGWVQENGGWRYYENGAPLHSVNCIADEGGRRYVFDEKGFLMTGDAEGDVLRFGNLYCINPEKDIRNPSTCYAVVDYVRRREAGVTYYDSDGITFVGWMNTGNGGRMYQTRILKENTGAEKDLYIYVWRAQYIPECQDPDYPGEAEHNIPAGRYLFGDDGILIQEAGWHGCKDGKAYLTDAQGRILEEGVPGAAESAAPAQTQSTPVQAKPYAPDSLPEGKLPMQFGQVSDTESEWLYIGESDDAYQAALEHINAMRAEKGIAPLVMDAELSKIATERCRTFADGGTYDHSGLTGFAGWEQRNENLMKNARSAKWACAGWYNSPGHYKTLMSPAFTRFGVGCAYRSDPLKAMRQGEDISYWVVVFELPEDWKA